MKLGEFINNFSHNNIIRLWYTIKGGHELVAEDINAVSMDWEVPKAKGVFRHYVNNEVLGLTTVLMTSGRYPEALNIVIERLENQPIIREAVDDIRYEAMSGT